MSKLRAALVTPLSGPLAAYGRASAAGLTLWARHAANLPAPWTEVELDVRDTTNEPAAAVQATIDTQPDVLFGPYGSSTMLATMRATNRVVWNHGGATSRLSWPAYPHVINVLSPASTYFDGVLQLVHATDPGVATVSILYASTAFGRDVASGAASTAAQLNFQVRAVPFESGHVLATTSTLPDADMLLVVGSFADELAAAPVLLARSWKAAAFVGAGVEEVLAPLGDLREGLIGPAQWMPTAALEPDEGPDSAWFVEKYRQIAGADPPYPAAQAFAAGLLCARCIRESGSSEDSVQLAMARRLACTTLYGRFRIDPESGLQAGHQVLIVQWQGGIRRIVWPLELAERPLMYPLKR